MRTLDESGLSAAALAAGVDWLTKRKDQPFSENISFAMVNVDGKVTAKNNMACHAQMNGVGYELIATVSCWATYRYQTYLSYSNPDYRGFLPSAILERFYDWFVNRSWAAEYIVAPDLGFATYVGIMFSTDIPSNYALAIATMSRNCGEQAHNVRRMFDYVDEFGISEDLAYYLAFGIPTENKYGTVISGHNLFMMNGANGLDIWMRRDIQQTNKPLRKTTYKSGVNNMWGPYDPKHVDSFERFKAKVEMGSIVIPNPFKPVVKSNTMTEEFLRDIIPNIAREYPEIKTMKEAA